MKELIAIQSKLRAPKSQYNGFGKYKYRSAEDILEAVKPLLAENNCILTITDEIEMVGARIYVKATCTIVNEDGQVISTTAYAREAETKSGMDASQITGAASSYARKYALNGLFAIDDNKDSDATNKGQNDEKPNPKQPLATDPDLELALNDIRNAKSVNELIDLHKRWGCFQGNDVFKSALTNRKHMLQGTN